MGDTVVKETFMTHGDTNEHENIMYFHTPKSEENIEQQRSRQELLRLDPK